jgi:short-subunit dehydrogenase
VRGFSESIMKELRDDGIKVTCFYPGSIETNFFDVAGVDMTDNPMQPESVSGTVMHVLEAPDNYLISEVVMRPLRPRG